jgi:hypothetical protein
MGSPSYFGKLVNFAAAARKNAFIPFGLFGPQDAAWLGVVVAVPISPVQSITEYGAVGTQTIDSSSANVFQIFVLGNITAMTINYAGSSLIPTGTAIELRFIMQTTSFTVVLPPNVIVDQGFAVDPGPNRTTVLPIIYDGNNWVMNGQAFSVQGH